MIDVTTISIISIIAFIIFTIIGWKRTDIKNEYSAVIDAIVEHFIDERSFTPDRLEKYTGMDKNTIKKYLDKLVKEGVLVKGSGAWYKLKDPLVFLTEKDYNRAIRLTRDDDILYGAYQNPYFLHFYFLGIYSFFIAVLFIIAGIYFGLLESFRNFLVSILPGGESTLPVFLLFLIAATIILVDALDNLIKAWSRERYSVIIGKLSGISYDRSLADELSGRIQRGKISGVDIQLSPLQKLANYFIDPPIGNVVVKVKGQKKPIIFKNMPYPREMFFVIRSIMLGSLGWRKRHARTLMLWRAKGMVPSIKA